MIRKRSKVTLYNYICNKIDISRHFDKKKWKYESNQQPVFFTITQLYSCATTGFLINIIAKCYILLYRVSEPEKYIKYKEYQRKYINLKN